MILTNGGEPEYCADVWPADAPSAEELWIPAVPGPGDVPAAGG